MKKYILITLFVYIPLFGQVSAVLDDAESKSLSFTLTPSFVSEFIFRGQYLGGASFQPMITADYGDFELGIWANDSFSKKSEGQIYPEIDPFGSYTYNINDSLNIESGFMLYTYYNAIEKDGFYKVTFEPYVGINYTIKDITFSPKIYYDVVLQGPTYEFNASYSIPIKKFELDFNGTVGTYNLTKDAADSSTNVRAWANYWLVGVAAPFTINKSSKLTIGWSYTGSNDAYIKDGNKAKIHDSSTIGPRGFVSLSYEVKF